MSALHAGVKFFARATAIAIVSLLSACGTFYVDNNLHELTPSERVAVASPKPVQLLFDFQTKGVSNSTARDLLKDTVTKSVLDSGLFSSVSPEAQADGALLQVTINNVPLTDDAFAKGFAVGFTFGLVGATVGDGYICTVDYIGGPTAPKISKALRDAVYLSMGATAKPPEHATQVKSMEDAVKTMTHKVVGNALNQLAADPGFAK